MAKNAQTIDAALGLLSAAPVRLAAAASDLSALQLQTAPSDGEWSANDVLAHLRACADVWGGWIERMLMEERPTLRAINPRRWIRQTDYLDTPFDRNLHAFSAQRARLLSILEPLPPEGWSRTAILTGAGKPLERRVRSEAEALAIHERTHLKQIARVAEDLRRHPPPGDN